MEEKQEGKETEVPKVGEFAPPGLVKNLKATPGDGWARITWDRPDSQEPIVEYFVRRTDKSIGEYDYRGSARLVPVYGLMNEKLYAWEVWGRNINGAGEITTVECTPRAVETLPATSPPTKVMNPAVVVNMVESKKDGRMEQRAIITWEPPLDDGNSPVLSYLVTLQGMGLNEEETCELDEREIAFAELSPGDYEVRVHAVNQVGRSQADWLSFGIIVDPNDVKGDQAMEGKDLEKEVATKRAPMTELKLDEAVNRLYGLAERQNAIMEQIEIKESQIAEQQAELEDLEKDLAALPSQVYVIVDRITSRATEIGLEITGKPLPKGDDNSK